LTEEESCMNKFYSLCRYCCLWYFLLCLTVRSCWEWENKMRSILALIIFIFGCYYFEPYMIPGMALLILLKYYLVRHFCLLFLLKF